MSQKELQTKVKELKELKALATELDTEITAIEDSIKAVMLSNNIEEMNVDVYKLRYANVTSQRFDTKAFKKTHTELYNQYTKTTTSMRFSIV